MKKSTVKTVDHGAKEMLRKMEQHRKKLLVGVLDPQASAKHPKADVSVGQIAVWMEYGTETSPAHSFIRDWVDSNQKVIIDQFAADYHRVIFAHADETAALNKRGSEYSKKIVGTIKRRIPPPNKPSTLLQKKGDVPLVDTTTLIKSIKFKVEE